MAKITGAKAHSDRLKRMTSPEAREGIYKALFAGGQRIEIAAELSITSGSVSGANHVPSLPGEPPNRDTGQLDGDIETTGNRTQQKVWVTSNAPYSRALEEGTSKMAARPFMGPAARKERGAVTELVRKAVSRAIRKGA